MKAILNRRTIIILSTALLLAIISIISVNVFNSSGPVTGFANTVTRPVRALATTVARTFSRIFSALYEYDVLVAQNEELVRQIAEMQADYRESQLVREENDRLRQLLDFRERHSGYEQEMASIAGPGGDNWSSSFVINMGYNNSGISRGDSVTTEFGVLIGQVYDVGPDTSTVITVLDTKFSAAAYVGRTDTDSDLSTSAVAKGDFAYMNSGRLLLDQVDENLLVRKGDYVITSGLGGVFPPGLIIGMIDEVTRNASGIGQYALIVPSVNFDTVTNVFIITGWDEYD